ncbi:hypothetical protein OG21DRAFT_1502618 [Imleria badia]|nr:hypothetical protein OG21DRAFT_1502618 [Imleria badia]
MELSELSSTPSSAQPQSILVNAQGGPLRINLQAVELEGRPKLVRTLKGAGALVASNAKEAAIILVDSTTESGKRLIRTWGHDASKVVLEHTWVRASVNIGRPLLEADNWGGAMTIDDGKPVTIDGVVVDEDELDEVEALVTKSPLPTPRVTPVDPTTQRPEDTVAEPSDITRSESNTLVPRVTGLPPGPPIAQSAVVGTTPPEEPMMDTNDDRPQSPPPPPAAQPLPYFQPTLFAQPSQPQNTYAYAPYATQQAYPSSQSQLMPTQSFPHTGLASFQPQVIHALSVPHTPLPSVQSQMTQMTSNTISLDGPDFQTPNLATIMTIMEVVRHMDHSSWFSQNQMPVSQPPVNSNTSTFSVQPPVTPGPTLSQATGGSESPRVDASFSSSQGHLSDTATSSRKHGSVTEVSEDRSMTRKSRMKLARHPPDETLTPSISRKRPPAVKLTNPPPKRWRKGKEKAIFTDSSEHSEVDELMEASDDLQSAHSSASPPAHPRNIVARKKHGEIFLSGSGQPLRFFVQVDLHGRHTVVTNIKKNKGKIVNNIADADYLILFSRSDTFQGLLSEATALGKSPILAAFVADCIEEGALLDETDYILESVAKVKALKRGRQNAFSIKVETPVSFSQQTNIVKPKSSLATDGGKKSRGTPSKSSTDKKLKKQPRSAPSKPTVEKREDSTASRPPTPPPASTRRLMSSGKYLFTEAEDEYFLCLAKHHLTRDPTISNTALVHRLHELMPHHTFASWGAHIDKKLKGAVEDIRKRANIAKRKRDNEAASQNLSQGPVNGGIPSKRRILNTAEGNDIPLNPSQPSQQDLERQDFEVITQFFASGGGDDDDDERVWQELEKHRQCRSASSWPEYYAAHEKQVYARIEELMNEHAGD